MVSNRITAIIIAAVLLVIVIAAYFLMTKPKGKDNNKLEKIETIPTQESTGDPELDKSNAEAAENARSSA